MKLTEFIRDQFARTRARRGAAGETLGHEDPSARRLAVYGMVGRSVAPRDIHLTSGNAEVVLHAASGRLQGASLREGAETVAVFDFSGRPAMLVEDRERLDLLRGFIAFMARPGQIGLRLEPQEGEPGAHGLGPELLVGDPALFEGQPVEAPSGGETALEKPREPAVAEPSEAGPAPMPGAAEPAAQPEPGGAAQTAPDPVGKDKDAGDSVLLSQLAGRLAGHVDESVFYETGGAGQGANPFDGIDAFVAKVSPDLGETLLLVYSGGDGDGESLAIAVDNGSAVALQLRRTRLGKVFQEWQALAPGDN